MKLSYIYKSEKDKTGAGFFQVQFDSCTKEEIKQLADLFEVKVSEMKGTWICAGQMYTEDKMLDCIQVYTDTWGSNCDTVFADYKADFIENLQILMTKVKNTDNAERLLGTSIELKVA